MASVVTAAPTDHAALFRFEFTGDEGNVILDNVDRDEGDSGLTINEAEGTISGWSDVASGLSNGAGRLFVYGTLQRGEQNHHELRGARFLRLAQTARRYAVRHVAGFPALLPGTDEVSGELYDVDADVVARLDVFEGEAYARRLVELSDGTRAEAYFLADSSLGSEEDRAARRGRC